VDKYLLKWGVHKVAPVAKAAAVISARNASNLPVLARTLKPFKERREPPNT
jgi:hypothetical protein